MGFAVRRVAWLTSSKAVVERNTRLPREAASDDGVQDRRVRPCVCVVAVRWAGAEGRDVSSVTSRSALAALGPRLLRTMATMLLLPSESGTLCWNCWAVMGSHSETGWPLIRNCTSVPSGELPLTSTVGWLVLSGLTGAVSVGAAGGGSSMLSGTTTV